MQDKNSFAALLLKLQRSAGIKNAVLAKALGYDVSYISKWTSAKSLPSQKGINAIAEITAELVCESAGERVLEELSKELDFSCDMAAESIRRLIIEACNASRDGQEREQDTDKEPLVDYFVSADALYAAGEIARLRGKINYGMIDIFSMEKDARLMLAGIEKGHFIYDEKEDVKYKLVVSLAKESSKEQDCVYDCIFLIHMLTSFSAIDFELYNHCDAKRTVMYCADGSSFVTGHLSGMGDRVSGLAIGDGEKEALAICRDIEGCMADENLIFRKISIDHMTESNEYACSLISTNVRWLLGHITELLLPERVFEHLLSNMPKQKQKRLRELYLLAGNVIRQPGCRTLLYESAISEFAISGEVDFFNNRMFLDAAGRAEVINYLVGLLDEENGASLRLIEGGFSSDFRYITNPCVFFSDSICYVRLENGRYEDNILILSDKRVRTLFGSFCDEIWDNRTDVVISEKSQIEEKLLHYSRQCELLEKM